jgi:hypothetical protein
MYQMRKNSFLAKLARALTFAALLASVAVADQKARAEFSQEPGKARPAAVPVTIDITDVTCNPCTGGSNAVLVVKWKTTINPRSLGTVKLVGYNIKGNITSCGVTSTCPGNSAEVSAPANATSANITLSCGRVDGCNYSVTLTLKFTDSGAGKIVTASKTGSFPQIG